MVIPPTDTSDAGRSTDRYARHRRFSEPVGRAFPPEETETGHRLGSPDQPRERPQGSDRGGDGGPARPAGEGDVRVTALLRQANRREALDALIPLVYDTLRSIARQQLARERQGHTLSATALAHEAYGRLVGLTRIEWRDRAHFFAAAAGAMRRVLVDYATARNALKRGAGAHPVAFDHAGLVAEARVDDLLAVDEALAQLERIHAGAARVVECRVFAGMTIDETAAALDVSPATVKRHWELARVWLAKQFEAHRE